MAFSTDPWEPKLPEGVETSLSECLAHKTREPHLIPCVAWCPLLFLTEYFHPLLSPSVSYSLRLHIFPSSLKLFEAKGGKEMSALLVQPTFGRVVTHLGVLIHLLRTSAQDPSAMAVKAILGVQFRYVHIHLA